MVTGEQERTILGTRRRRTLRPTLDSIFQGKTASNLELKLKVTYKSLRQTKMFIHLNIGC